MTPKNHLTLECHYGTNLTTTVTGIDPETSLTYRFDQFTDIQMHISVSAIDPPYKIVPLEFDQGDPRQLVVEVLETQLMNSDVVSSMVLVNPPPYFVFSIIGKKDGVNKVLFDGIINYTRFGAMKFSRL
ncbi:hypothetical protein SHAb15599_00153 [Acinetobacter phage SH-Ab 15599]|nr:hypothetical protein SHAb15599_00153 [Acinetobacter phage SH-Ab 15599]